MVIAPLAVWAGLNVPQDPAGAQLQSTPAFELSLETVAEIDAVPPAERLAGGLLFIVIEGFVGLGLPGLETLPPQPEKYTVRRKRLAITSSAHFDVTYCFCNLASSYLAHTSSLTAGSWADQAKPLPISGNRNFRHEKCLIACKSTIRC